MKEFFKLLFTFNLKALFKDDTENPFIQFFRYLFVGGLATVVDWSVLELCFLAFNINLYLSAAIGFIFGLITNFFLSKFFAFKGTPTTKALSVEVLVHIITGVIGLGFTEAILWFMTEVLARHHLISKAVATLIVLMWNFGSKKIILYRKRNSK